LFNTPLNQLVSAVTILAPSPVDILDLKDEGVCIRNALVPQGFNLLDQLEVAVFCSNPTGWW
jgi:hypothetical protein